MGTSPDVIVAGAGLAGLACARSLVAGGATVSVVEASNGVGGRVRSDVVDGFILDRGFQVLLSAYPEAKAMLDYAALDLRYFLPSSLVWADGALHRMSDPTRRPLDLLATVRAPVGSLRDKARVGAMRLQSSRHTIEQIWSRPETSTAELFRSEGFSDTFLDRFLRPLFGGIQLDATLATSSRMAEFVFKMLAEGGNAVPARGMQAIPDQLAAGLPPGSIRLNEFVRTRTNSGVTLSDGSTLSAPSVVIATDGSAAAEIVGHPESVGEPVWNGVSCVYFAASTSPLGEPTLVLNGSGQGVVNNLAVMSDVSPMYAPAKSHLVAASVLGTPDGDLHTTVAAELRTWFGAQVDVWRHLRTYRIPHAQPSLTTLEPAQRPVRLGDGLYVCGDHRDQASIHGALVSGRRAAEAILADR